MPESNITGITAPIYSADLLYEQQCKCGVIVVLATGEDWTYDVGGDDTVDAYVWKIVAIEKTGNALAGLESDFGSPKNTDCTKIITSNAVDSVDAGWEIMGKFTKVECAEGCFILYKDCLNS